MQKGFTRLYHTGEQYIISIENLLMEEEPTLDMQRMYILIDRLVVKDFEEDELHRVADSIQVAFDETLGDVYLEIDAKRTEHFCNRFELDGIRFEKPTPDFFSSNNPYGACPDCEGFGQVRGRRLLPSVIPNKNLSVHEGAVVCWNGEKMSEWKTNFIYTHKSKFPVREPYS